MLTITGTPTDISWLGAHTYRIKCTNGSSPGAPKGLNGSGLYKSVDSSPFTVVIVDPCTRSVVNQDLGVKTGLIEAPSTTWTPSQTGFQIVVTGDDTLWTTPPIDGPTDSIG